MIPPVEPATTEGQPSLGRAALLGLCPRCGARTLFDGVANFAPECRVCDVDFGRFNVGDGPAAFLTMAIGAIVIVLAGLLHMAVAPPFWVHALIWVPVTTLLVVGGLRVSKATLLIVEYRRDAREAVTPGQADADD